jgi:hypothetical protein
MTLFMRKSTRTRAYNLETFTYLILLWNEPGVQQLRVEIKHRHSKLEKKFVKVRILDPATPLQSLQGNG